MIYKLKKIMWIIFGVEAEVERRVWRKLDRERSIMAGNWMEIVRERNYYRLKVELYEGRGVL